MWVMWLQLGSIPKEATKNLLYCPVTYFNPEDFFK
jgi:hypothetical protein